MPLSLALVTCTPQLEVALADESLGAVSLVRLAGRSPRSTLLLAAADLLLEDAGQQPDGIARVLVSRGPGSFTGIRAGLAVAAGLAAASGAEVIAYDSLLVQAARCSGDGVVWAAQPGRRGEVYARSYRLGRVPEPVDDVSVLQLEQLASRHPEARWIAAEAVDLGGAARADAVRSAAEALLVLAAAGAAPDPAEPLYVEGPPVHLRAESE